MGAQTVETEGSASGHGSLPMPSFKETIARLFFGESVVAVARSLETAPQEWTREGMYGLTHKSGICIWIGNDSYGLSINEGHSMGAKHWGGVTFLSSLRLSPGHHLLSAALRRWRAASQTSVAARLFPNVGAPLREPLADAGQVPGLTNSIDTQPTGGV